MAQAIFDTISTRDILNGTVAITVAYIAAQPTLSLANIVDAIHAIRGALGTPTEQPVASAVDPRRSVFTDHLVCLECGTWAKQLKRHLRTAHDLSPAQYLAKHGLPDTYPLVSPAYSQKRSQMARDMGFGLKRKRNG
jgi:predicted transcriptional regulator